MNYSKYEKEKAAVGNTLNCFAFWIAFYWSEHYYSGQWYCITLFKETISKVFLSLKLNMVFCKSVRSRGKYSATVLFMFCIATGIFYVFLLLVCQVKYTRPYVL